MVGDELEKLTNFALNAKVIGMSFANTPDIKPLNIVKNLFNGKKVEERLSAMLAYEFTAKTHWLAFDIGKEKEISSWLTDTRYDYAGNIVQDIKKGELYYFIGEGEPVKNDMTDETKWQKADEYDDSSLTGEYSKNFASPIRARYWKYQIKEQAGMFCISEIQLNGKGGED